MWKFIILFFVAAKEIFEIIIEAQKETVPTQPIGKKPPKNSIAPAPPIQKQKIINKRSLLITIKIIAVVGLLLIAIYDLIDSKNQSQINSKVGLFSNRYLNVKHPYIYFGSNRGYNNNALLTHDNNKDQLKASVENNVLVMDVNILDSYKNPLATLKPEGWQIFSTQIQYNDDANGFEVVRYDNKVIFQVNLIEDTVYFNGILYNGNQCEVIDTVGGFQQYTIPNGAENIWIPDKVNIPPLFRYPRDQFHGVRATPIP